MKWIVSWGAALCAVGWSGGAAGTGAVQDEAAVPAAATFSRAPAAEPEGRRTEEKNDLLEFTYVWPGAAASVGPLHARLEAEMKALRKEALATAVEDKAGRTADFPFHGHYLSKVWQTYGSSPRLLTLGAPVETFTGGAHGNVAFDSILWDRTASTAIGFGDLFADPAAGFAALTPAYCRTLDQERSIRREEPLPLEGDDWMTGCPAVGEQVVIPADEDGNGRFETLSVLIPPYEAGPYAEGAYVLEMPVGVELIPLLKPGYSDSFESSSRPAGPKDQPQ